MSRRSRGCLRCRQRRVKCDQGKPACMRCTTRNELCVGYRDESDLIFQHETTKVLARNSVLTQEALPQSAASPEQASVTTASRSRSRSLSRLDAVNTPATSPETSDSPFFWNRDFVDANTDSAGTDDAVSLFFDKYVVPCNELSSPGFLEHLPCLFKESNVQGRSALRWAVQACAYADIYSRDTVQVAAKLALELYSRALSELGKSLSIKGKIPDDHDLMTVVILDLFETLFMPDMPSQGSHVQGMANILRLRGHAQFYDPRGWSLFRLAHHRMQKQQLVKGMRPLQESTTWLETYTGTDSFSLAEKNALKISNICREANDLLDHIQDTSLSAQSLVPLIQRMSTLDHEATTWREESEWSFQTIDRQSALGDTGLAALLPQRLEIHQDLWMAYEWNYHRAARITLHHQLIHCIDQATASISEGTAILELQQQRFASVEIVQKLSEQVLSTVPQSFGDVDSSGRMSMVKSVSEAIGGYFLLWPIKIIKGANSAATSAQKDASSAVFERIRECTGMKENLGSLSII